MNVATIKVAEMVGYNTVVNLAHKAGINEDVKATPAMALGSYDATPLEMAGAYTVFANNGVRVQPIFIDDVRGVNGASMFRSKPQTKTVLDPRVNYLMVSLLEEVIAHGNCGGRAGQGFHRSSGRQDGTSHDGWFAGFTSQLLCIVWVGFDDNSVLGLQGAHSALPVWTEFMKRALAFRGYRDAKPFNAPDGIVTLQIDPKSGMPATPYSEGARSEVFIAGTEPVGVDPSVLPRRVWIPPTWRGGIRVRRPCHPVDRFLRGGFNPLPPTSLDQPINPTVSQNATPLAPQKKPDSCIASSAVSPRRKPSRQLKATCLFLASITSSLRCRSEAKRTRGIFTRGCLDCRKRRSPPIWLFRGNCWFESGFVKVHLGVEKEFAPARKAHPAFVVDDLPALVSLSKAAGTSRSKMSRRRGSIACTFTIRSAIASS